MVPNRVRNAMRYKTTPPCLKTCFKTQILRIFELKLLDSVAYALLALRLGRGNATMDPNDRLIVPLHRLICRKIPSLT